MINQSVPAPAFYRHDGTAPAGDELFESLPTTAGPWTSTAQHGGPPAALLARAVERLADPGTVLGRFTMELWGPVPVGPVRTSARVLRPGRSVQLLESELYDAERDRLVASARCWFFPGSAAGPVQRADPTPHSPADGVERPRPERWGGGYLDAVEWRWLRGGLEEPGSGLVWMRPPTLVEGEPLSPVQRLLACVDSASGVSAALDVADWGFLNTELSVHVLRPPEGEWICLDAETRLGSGSVGIATASVSDVRGMVAHSTQALLVVPRP